jgi:choline transport protein
MMINLALVVALGAIQIGSLTALNAILGGAVVLGTVSFGLTLGCALWRGRDYMPRTRWLNLHRFGTPIRYIALIWCAFISVWLCFPLYLPVTPAYMNWASVVVAGVLIGATIYWFVRPVAQSVLEHS